MPNLENLVKGDDVHKFTHEEASKGGKKSAEVRREKRDLKRAMEILLEREFKDKEGKVLSGAEVLALRQFEKAMKGDGKAFEIVRDTSGQKPVEKVMVAEVEQSVIDEVEAIVMGEEYSEIK